MLIRVKHLLQKKLCVLFGTQPLGILILMVCLASPLSSIHLHVGFNGYSLEKMGPQILSEARLLIRLILVRPDKCAPIIQWPNLV